MTKNDRIYFDGQNELPLDNFIENAMYNKDCGYYVKKNPFGKKGDYITSPGISFLFSEMIALWIVSFWEHLNKPKKFNIVELGPGNGELSKILIKTFMKFHNFYRSSNIYLYEKSKSLKYLQKKNINNNKINWINNFKEIKKGPTIFFVNEFFDAIPIKQYIKLDNKIYEKFIKIDKSNKISTNFRLVSKKITIILNKFNLLENQTFIEYPKKGIEELSKITSVIKKSGGGILLVDYGFLKPKSIDTLQSVKNHKTNNIYENIGEADITSLVNFKLLKDFFVRKKLKINDIVTQGSFLKKLGIIERAEILGHKMNFKKKSDLYFRLQRLISSKHMGKLFKVIFAYKIKKTFLLGFD